MGPDLKVLQFYALIGREFPLKDWNFIVQRLAQIKNRIVEFKLKGHFLEMKAFCSKMFFRNLSATQKV